MQDAGFRMQDAGCRVQGRPPSPPYMYVLVAMCGGGAWHPDMMLSSTSWRRAWHPHGKRVWKRPACGGGAILDIVCSPLLLISAVLRADNVKGGSSREVRSETGRTA